MKGDKMDTRMNRRWIVLALIGMVALGAQPETDTEKVRRLEAENRMLRAQVASLKRKLAGKKPTTPAPTTRPALPPGTKALTLTVKENDESWWSDLPSFAKEIQTRLPLAEVFPDESLAAWAGRHKNFVGAQVTWKIQVMKVRQFSEADASREYYQAKGAVKEWQSKLARALKAKGRPETLKELRDRARRQIAEAEANTEIFGAMKDKGGGAKITARDTTQAAMPVVVVDIVQVGKVDLKAGGTVTARGVVAGTQIEGGHRKLYGLLRFRLKP